jgi:hypothetical protein
MNQLHVVAGNDEVIETEQGPLADCYNEIRCEIARLLATVKALVALLPQTE